MIEPRRPNRGPSAAQGNRSALVAAALEVFAESGINAPLNSVAKRAGVGQGSLYRHFPDRISLALAALEDNVAALEAAATVPGRTLDDLLIIITQQTIDSIAFVDLVTRSAADPRMEAVADRVRRTLETALPDARRTGAVRESLSADELMLAIGMVAGVVAKTPAAERRAVAERAWQLMRHGMH